MKQILTLFSPLGLIHLEIEDKQVSCLHFADGVETPSLPKDGLAFLMMERLSAYFKDPMVHFRDIPLAPAKSDFGAKVRTLLLSLCPGEVLTYGEAARLLKTSPRALGQSLAKNPLPIVIPCHRIVAKNGEGGYMGYKQHPIKSWLLTHERR